MLMNEITNKFAHLDALSPEERGNRMKILHHINHQSKEEKDELDYLQNMGRKFTDKPESSQRELYQHSLAKAKEQLQKAISQYENTSDPKKKNMLKGFMIPKFMDSVKKYQDLLDQAS